MVDAVLYCIDLVGAEDNIRGDSPVAESFSEQFAFNRVRRDEHKRFFPQILYRYALLFREGVINIGTKNKRCVQQRNNSKMRQIHRISNN